MGIAELAHSSMVIKSATAKVTPLRALRTINRTATTKKAQAVLTAESVIIVCLLFGSPLVLMARIVPVADVMPGIIETRMPAKLPVMTDKIDDLLAFLSNLGCSILCLGILGFVTSEVKRVGVPNNPARAGNKTGEDNPMGEYTEILDIAKPKNPERINRNAANKIPTMEGILPFFPKMSILPFSVIIISNEMAISTHSIISLKVE